jgi:hypothetical protein
MSTGILVAKLSLSAFDDNKIKEALISALQWSYGKFNNPIYGLFLSSPRTAIVYADKDLAKELLEFGSNDFQLGGPLSASFTSGERYMSNFVQLDLSGFEKADDKYDVVNQIRELFLSSVGVFMREKELALRFDSSEVASDSCGKIRALSVFKNRECKIDVIPIRHHAMLKCIWKGSSPFSTTLKRLSATGQSITNLVQSCVRYD